MQMPYSTLQVLPPRQGADAPGVGLMASLSVVQLLTIEKTCLPLMSPGVQSVNFWNASQAKTAGETFIWVPVHDPE